MRGFLKDVARRSARAADRVSISLCMIVTRRGGDAPGLPRLVRGRRRRADHRRHGLYRPHGRDRRVVRRHGAALAVERLASPTPATPASTRATGTHILWLDADERLEESDASGCEALAAPAVPRGALADRDQLHGPGGGRHRRQPPGAAAAAPPAAVPLHRHHPRADAHLDADRPARALRLLRPCASATTATSRPASRSATRTTATSTLLQRELERDAAQRVHAVQRRHRVRLAGRRRQARTSTWSSRTG